MHVSNPPRFTPSLQNLKDVTLRSRREAIIKFLEVEPIWTVKHLAQLLPLDKQGQKLKPHLITKPDSGRVTEYPGAYQHVLKMLNRMEKAGDVRRHKQAHNNLPHLWTLKNTRVPVQFWNYKHEMDCLDLFVRYWQTGKLEHWDAHWSPEETEKKVQDFKVFYDRRMVLNGQLYFWEVDRGTEDLEKQVFPKVDKYLELSRKFFGERFYILFTMQYKRYSNLSDDEEYDRQTKRCSALTKKLASDKRGNQVLVARHQSVLDDPLGKVFVSPLSNSFLSLEDLE